MKLWLIIVLSLFILQELYHLVKNVYYHSQFWNIQPIDPQILPGPVDSKASINEFSIISWNVWLFPDLAEKVADCLIKNAFSAVQPTMRANAIRDGFKKGYNFKFKDKLTSAENSQSNPNKLLTDVIVFVEAFSHSNSKIFLDALREKGYTYTTAPHVGGSVLERVLRFLYNFIRYLIIENIFCNGCCNFIPEFFNTISPLLKIANSGVRIVSKYPITKQDRLVYRNVGKSEFTFLKGVTYAKVMHSSGPVHVFGTHMQSYNQNKKERTRQFEELNNFIKKQKIDEAREPVFIVGDLNVNRLDLQNYPEGKKGENGSGENRSFTEYDVMLEHLNVKDFATFDAESIKDRNWDNEPNQPPVVIQPNQVFYPTFNRGTTNANDANQLSRLGGLAESGNPTSTRKKLKDEIIDYVLLRKASENLVSTQNPEKSPVIETLRHVAEIDETSYKVDTADSTCGCRRRDVPVPGTANNFDFTETSDHYAVRASFTLNGNHGRLERVASEGHLEADTLVVEPLEVDTLVEDELDQV